jgi:hypothetical protein
LSCAFSDNWVIHDRDADPEWTSIVLAARSSPFARPKVSHIDLVFQQSWISEHSSRNTDTIVVLWCSKAGGTLEGATSATHTSRWIVLVVIDKQADLIPWLGALEPEVHHNCEVLGIITCSIDTHRLIAKRGTFFAVTEPDNISTIFCYDGITAISAENGIPAKTTRDHVCTISSVDNVFTGITIEHIHACISKDEIITVITVNGIVAISSIYFVVAEFL